jgi:hypothetical protein
MHMMIRTCWIILALVLGAAAPAAARPADVTIVNTAPIPVSISGTPSVGISPSANDVDVNSSPAAPLRTREAAQVFADSASLNPAAGVTNCIALELATGRLARIDTALASTSGAAAPNLFLRFWTEYDSAHSVPIDIDIPVHSAVTTGAGYTWAGSASPALAVLGGTESLTGGGVATKGQICAKAPSGNSMNAVILVSGVYLD